MDLSKLPRLSETDKHTPTPSPQTNEPAPVQAEYRRPVEYAGPTIAERGPGGQVWISLVVGLLLIMFGWNFARFLIAKLTGQTFHTNVNWTSGPLAGQEVSYLELQGYTAYSEAGMFLFGVALVLEAIMLALVRDNNGKSRALVGAALCVTVLATALNIVVCVLLLNSGILPLMSGLAVAFGGYMAIYEWQMLREFLASSERA